MCVCVRVLRVTCVYVCESERARQKDREREREGERDIEREIRDMRRK